MERKNRLDYYLGRQAPQVPNNMDINVNDSEYISNFENLYKTTKAIHDRNRDLRTSIQNIEVVKDANNIKLYERERDILLPFSDWSLSQFCGLIGGIQAGYIKKCLEYNKVDLALKNLDEWLKDKQKSLGHKDKSIFIRHSDRIHGILSDRYAVLDDLEVLEMVRDQLPYRMKFIVQSYFISEEMMNVRLIQRTPLHVEDQDLFIGVNIWNSRVGRSSLNVSILIFKQICTNGLIVQEGDGTFYIQRHVGIDREKFIFDFHRMLTQLPRSAEYLEQKIERAIDFKMDEDERDFILARFQADTKASDKAVAAIEKEYTKYGNHRFGLLNKITEEAQNYSLETKEAFEKFAGEYLFVRD